MCTVSVRSNRPLDLVLVVGAEVVVAVVVIGGCGCAGAPGFVVIIPLAFPVSTSFFVVVGAISNASIDISYAHIYIEEQRGRLRVRACVRARPSVVSRSISNPLSFFFLLSLSLSLSHARTHTHSLSLFLCACVRGDFVRKRKREKRRRTQKITHAEIFFFVRFLFFCLLANSGSCVVALFFMQ